MPDITMCYGRGCKIKDQCYRHTAEPSPFRQSYFVIAPVNILNGWCDEFTSNNIDPDEELHTIEHALERVNALEVDH